MCRLLQGFIKETFDMFICLCSMETDEHIKCLLNETMTKTRHLKSPIGLKEDQEMALKLSMRSGFFQNALPHSDRRTPDDLTKEKHLLTIKNSLDHT
jgi:hypothetical protein